MDAVGCSAKEYSLRSHGWGAVFRRAFTLSKCAVHCVLFHRFPCVSACCTRWFMRSQKCVRKDVFVAVVHFLGGMVCSVCSVWRACCPTWEIISLICTDLSPWCAVTQKAYTETESRTGCRVPRHQRKGSAGTVISRMGVHSSGASWDQVNRSRLSACVCGHSTMTLVCLPFWIRVRSACRSCVVSGRCKTHRRRHGVRL